MAHRDRSSSREDAFLRGEMAQSLYERLTNEEDARACADISDAACRVTPGNFLLILSSNCLTKLGDGSQAQLLVETLSVIFLVMIFGRLPKFSDVLPHSFGKRILNTAIAVTIGAGVFRVLYAMSTGHPDTTLIDYFAANSLIAAHGRNIVNVILVDFRAIDTLGEITVVVMAALGASAILLKKKRIDR